MGILADEKLSGAESCSKCSDRFFELLPPGSFYEKKTMSIKTNVKGITKYVGNTERYSNAAQAPLGPHGALMGLMGA